MLTARSVTLDLGSEQSVIHIACQGGNLQEVQAALLDGERAVNSFQDGVTPLHSAVVSGSTQACDIIQILLENGADINAQTRGEEDTALHLVVENGNFPRDFDLVLMMLENDVDLSIRNRKLRTAYDCALGKGHFELASILEGSMPPEQARRFYTEKIGEKYGPCIISAVLQSDEEQLQEYIRLGGNPNMMNKHGAGAIHYAITRCTLPVLQVLQYLLDAGADVNLRDDEGDNALNLAIKSKELRETGNLLPVVTFLVKNGADQTLKDLDGKDAFMMAEERGYSDVLHVLKGCRQQRLSKEDALEGELSEPTVPHEEFPDPNAENAEGLYPIHLATSLPIAAARYDQIESLIERGASVSQVTKQEGNTALHLCAEQNLGDSAEQLLKHHIDHKVKNKEGKTAYELARELGHSDVMAAIESREKEVQDKWKKGKKAGLCAIL